jgi:hypothetical protein
MCERLDLYLESSQPVELTNDEYAEINDTEPEPESDDEIDDKHPQEDLKEEEEKSAKVRREISFGTNVNVDVEFAPPPPPITTIDLVTETETEEGTEDETTDGEDDSDTEYMNEVFAALAKTMRTVNKKRKRTKKRIAKVLRFTDEGVLKLATPVGSLQTTRLTLRDKRMAKLESVRRFADQLNSSAQVIPEPSPYVNSSIPTPPPLIQVGLEATG